MYEAILLYHVRMLRAVLRAHGKYMYVEYQMPVSSKYMYIRSCVLLSLTSMPDQTSCLM